jgi:hypothetical protein
MGRRQLRASRYAAAVIVGGLLLGEITFAGSGFSQRFELQGYAFDVAAKAEGATSELTIIPHGLREQRGPIIVKIEGAVSGAEIADLDGNGFPELYVYLSSAGSGRYGSLVGYAVNKGKTMTEIYLPPVSENAKLRSGYRGYDEFAVVEGTFVQRFPIFRTGESSPSGKTRQLQYKLKQGEAGWTLRLDKTLEY